MSVEFVEVIEYPELIIGLVGPIGVDLAFVTLTISDVLKSFGYTSKTIKITDLITELTNDFEINERDTISNYNWKIDFANDIRKKFERNDVLAAVAVNAISDARATVHNTDPSQEVPIELLRREKTAYILRQLKTPEEVRLLRTVYGRQFMLVSIYASPKIREDALVAETRLRSRGVIEESAARLSARTLIERDSKEGVKFGQNVTDTFYQGDVFVDLANRHQAQIAISRYFNALFGSNEITPTHDEYGMYLAKSASLRSSDLSRQVGAAIFSENGEIISLGCNEVPKAGGGTYWSDGEQDFRDMRVGYEPNELGKIELFADVITRLHDQGMLARNIFEDKSAQAIVEALLDGNLKEVFKSSKLMSVIEFGRIIHAEMSAITDAARNGSSVRASTLYCTTFPCHLCAKHIVSSGILRVVYLEPYPKSYAVKLHGDSITTDQVDASQKVLFQPFMGISPFRYRDLFEKGKRKDSLGKAQKWMRKVPRPIIDILYPSYLTAERNVIKKLEQLTGERKNKGESFDMSAA